MSVKSFNKEELIQSLFDSNLNTDVLMATVNILKSMDNEVALSSGPASNLSSVLGLNFNHQSGDIYAASGLEEFDANRAMKNFVNIVVKAMTEEKGKRTHVVEEILDTDYEGKSEFILFLLLKGIQGLLPRD